jgi:hypothetical protein
MMQMAQRPFASFYLPYNIGPIVVTKNPVHRPRKRAVMTHIANLEEGVHR